MEIYVGNVPYAATEEDLEALFSEYGPVATAEIIRDRYDGRSKGFGFVEMENQEDGERAIEALDGKTMMGRPLKVNPARPREQRRRDRPNRSVKDESPQKRKPSRDVPEESPPTQKTGKFGPATHFHNPYTFVPTPPRPSDGFAGDFNPLCKKLNHSTLQDELWTGHIPIKLTAATPLVLLKTDGTREEGSEDPYDVHSRIPESSLRGMLRSAYETVTNSRYACFGREHEKRLAYRMHPGEATKLIPTIIKEDPKTGDLKALFYTGSSHPTNGGARKTRTQKDQRPTLNQIKEGVMYAALLSSYNKSKITYHGTTDEPKTGDEVYAEIVLCGSDGYRYWQTSRIWLKSKCSSIPAPGRVPHSWDMSKLYRGPNGNPIIEVVEGSVLITNQNIDKKGNERIFFYHNTKKQQEIVLKDDHKDYKGDWKALINNYRDAHTDDDIFDRTDRHDIPKRPWDVVEKSSNTTEYAWSPHLYHKKYKGEQKDRWKRDVPDAIHLQNGTMAYARCKIDDKTGTIKKVVDIFPVMISRELYKNTPEDLLDESLRPAEKLNDLSPADRLFGWTPQGESSDSGYKSRIRVVCDDSERSDVLEKFENDPLPLSILGEPKPEQGRFYVAADNKGTPQDKAQNKKDAGYDKKSNKQLRGRKHFWHHKDLEEDYWTDTEDDSTREYIRTSKIKDSQNRSIKAWIKPNTTFTASLYVQNLQPAEVGALLWLLTLSDEHYFRLGYGKPLGFGSVKIEIDTDTDRLVNKKLPLGKGSHWKEYYAKFNTSPPAEMDKDEEKKSIKTFKKSMVDAYMLKDFKELPFIKGFLQVLQGPNTDNPRIHYPRSNSKPDREGKNFKWFMDNEKGSRLALPAVTDDEGLPYKP